MGSVCCGQYDVCCDGYCMSFDLNAHSLPQTDFSLGCGEGATCADNGECMPAVLTWDDVTNGVEVSQVSDIPNTCLEIY